MTDTKTQDIEKLIKKVPGRMKVLRVMPYKGCQVYLRQIDEDIFMYDIVFEGQLYSDYIILTPEEGIDKLTENQINGAAGIIFTAATTTIDILFKKKEEAMMSTSIKTDKNKQKLLN
jgi:hypothetical protein